MGMADQQEGMIQRWFPGWYSTATPDVTNPLDEVDEDELMDELGLEMDASSQLLKDRIFADVVFTLTKGTLNLVSEDGADNLLGPASILQLEVH